ncbi:MAG: acyltransferase [Solirubrobacteraceae bacterium]
MTARAGRFPLFDSLRAIAALSVVVFHLAFVTGLPGWAHRAVPYVTQLGDVGVSIFFAISGFLLYRPFVAARLRRDAEPSIRAYALRRLLRILPAYWLALLVTALIAPHDEVFGPDALRYWLLLQGYWQDSIAGGIGPAWTLTIEMAFYAVLPLWVLAMRRVPFRSERGFLATELGGVAALCALSAVWRWAAIRGLPAGANPLSPRLLNLPAMADHFAVGMGLAVLSVAAARRSAATAGERFLARFPWVPWLVAAAAWYGMARFRPIVAGNGGHYAAHRTLELVLAGAFLLPAVFAWDAGGLVRRLLALKPLLWVGMVSYGVYLWHLDVITELSERTSLGRAGLWVVALATTIAIAAASWYALERHAIALGRRLGSRWVRPRRDPDDATGSLATPGQAK